MARVVVLGTRSQSLQYGGIFSIMDPAFINFLKMVVVGVVVGWVISPKWVFIIGLGDPQE